MQGKCGTPETQYAGLSSQIKALDLTNSRAPSAQQSCLKAPVSGTPLNVCHEGYPYLSRYVSSQNLDMQRSLTQECTIVSLRIAFTLPVTQPDVISPPEGPKVESHTAQGMDKTSVLSPWLP